MHVMYKCFCVTFQEERKAAEVFEEFVASFETSEKSGVKSGVKTFVRGGIVNATKGQQQPGLHDFQSAITRSCITILFIFSFSTWHVWTKDESQVICSQNVKLNCLDMLREVKIIIKSFQADSAGKQFSI